METSAYAAEKEKESDAAESAKLCAVESEWKTCAVEMEKETGVLGNERKVSAGETGSGDEARIFAAAAAGTEMEIFVVETGASAWLGVKVSFCASEKGSGDGARSVMEMDDGQGAASLGKGRKTLAGRESGDGWSVGRGLWLGGERA